MDWITKYPLLPIALVLAACVRFEYHTDMCNVVIPGLAGGIVVLAIVAIVVLYRIFNAVERLCRAKSWLKGPVKFRYDILIPIGIAAVAFKGHWFGPPIEGIEGKTRRWILQWSDSSLDVYFIVGLIGVVLMLRILELIRAIEMSTPARLETPA